MGRVSFRSPCEPLAELIDPETLESVGEKAEVRVVGGAEEDAGGMVSFVLDGGGLLICGAEGALPSALHFFPLVGGGVTGVGCVLRSGAAVGGPRGSGWAVCLAAEQPDGELLAECLDWIRRKSGGEGR